MDSKSLAIASVPIQSWNDVYNPEKALLIGTIFPELNKPFFVTENMDNQCPTKTDTAGKSQKQLERESLMCKIYSISFALNDLTLFLDTHPTEKNAISLKTNLLQERKNRLKEFAQKFYPLTQDCEGCWSEGPMPWEGACI